MPRRPTCMNINETLLNRGNILSRLMVIVFGVAGSHASGLRHGNAIARE